MLNHNLPNLKIAVDFKNDLIRIHKKTLYAIGRPHYILLLINPSEATLVIAPSNPSDPGAHYIKNCYSINNRTCVLYSKLLINRLKSLCIDWPNEQLCLLHGKTMVNHGKGVALFHMPKPANINSAVKLND